MSTRPPDCKDANAVFVTTVPNSCGVKITLLSEIASEVTSSVSDSGVIANARLANFGNSIDTAPIEAR